MRRITRLVGMAAIPGVVAPLRYRLELGRWPSLKPPRRLMNFEMGKWMN